MRISENFSMKANIYIQGEVISGETLKDVIRQYKSTDDATEVDVHIHSEGGSLDEGVAIYNYLKGLNVPVTTITDKAYSVSAQIFAAGDTRVVLDVEKAIMIHFAWVDSVSGDAETLEVIAQSLRKIEKDFAKFYAKEFDIDEETARNLLANETYLSGSEAVELGLASELKAELKAVARLKEFNLNLNKSEMKHESIFIKALRAVTGAKPEVKALVLQDSDGSDIDFVDLADGDTPKVGDKAEVDGVAISDGEHIFPQLENQTFVFVDGVVSEIKPEEDEADEADEAAAQAQAKQKTTEKKSEVKAEEISQITVWEINVINTTFAVGDKVEYDYEDESYAVGAGEFQLKDGRRIVTDATGTIVTVKESDVAGDDVEVDAEPEAKETNPEKDGSDELTEVVAMLGSFENNILEKLKAEMKKENDALKEELKAARKLMGSKEVEVKAKEDDGTQIKKPRRSQAELLRG